MLWGALPGVKNTPHQPGIHRAPSLSTPPLPGTKQRPSSPSYRSCAPKTSKPFPIPGGGGEGERCPLILWRVFLEAAVRCEGVRDGGGGGGGGGAGGGLFGVCGTKPRSTPLWFIVNAVVLAPVGQNRNWSYTWVCQHATCASQTLFTACNSCPTLAKLEHVPPKTCASQRNLSPQNVRLVYIHSERKYRDRLLDITVKDRSVYYIFGRSGTLVYSMIHVRAGYPVVVKGFFIVPVYCSHVVGVASCDLFQPFFVLRCSET